MDKFIFSPTRMIIHLSAATALLLSAPATADQSTPYDQLNATAASASVVTVPVRGNVTMLTGAGGNIAVLTAPDGQFMVDAGIAVAREQILDQRRRLGSGTPKDVVTTHWHWDHAEGNSWARNGGNRHGA